MRQSRRSGCVGLDLLRALSLVVQYVYINIIYNHIIIYIHILYTFIYYIHFVNVVNVYINFFMCLWRVNSFLRYS